MQRFAGLIRLNQVPKPVRPSLLQALLSSCEWYGLHRKVIRNRLRIGPSRDGFLEVGWRELTLLLPEQFPLERLASIIVELEVPSNPHYFFHPALRIGRDELVVDVGSCEGLFALLAAQRWPTSRILAVEPSAVMCSALAGSMARCGQQGRIVLENCLVGDRNDTVRFIENTADPAASRILGADETPGPDQSVTMVPMRKLDDLAFVATGKVALIKMDAEGAELDILKGARELLVRDRPALCITTYHNRDDAAQIYSWLSALALDYAISVRGLTCMSGTEPRPIMLFALPR